MIAIIFDFGSCLFDHVENKLVEGAEMILTEYRKKYKLALISLTTHVNERIELIEALALNNMFDKIIIVNKNFEVKEPKHFLECCDEFKCRPDECYVVGDRIKREIKIGNSLGMRTIWFRYKNSEFKDEMPESDEEKPKHIIYELSELKRIIS